MDRRKRWRQKFKKKLKESPALARKEREKSRAKWKRRAAKVNAHRREKYFRFRSYGMTSARRMELHGLSIVNAKSLEHPVFIVIEVSGRRHRERL